MISKNIFSFMLIGLIWINTSFSQPWMPLENDSINYNKAVASFNNYWANKEIEKGKGFKQFKRWEWFWEHRVKEDGSFYPAGINENNFKVFLKQNKSSNRNIQANWQSEGPDFSLGGYAGIGRVNSLGFDPSDNNIVYVGAAGGGFWKSTNGGNSWNTTTDGLGALGVSGIAVHPVNHQIIFIATGDGDASDNYSIGVLKSTDGGSTFSPTGLNWSQTNTRVIRRILIDNDNHDILMVASSNGIYRSTNGGVTWTQVQTGSFYDLEAKPGLNQTVWYASTSSAIFKSTNEGQTWTSVYAISGSNRNNLTVSAANPNYVYVISSLSSGSGFKGVYRSADSGSNFTLRSSTPNILNSSGSGTGTGGQGWYDLAFVADPNNAEIIYAGGINTWKSIDGGATWTIRTHWSGYTGVQTTHADKHVLEFKGNVLWEGNDGGVYRSPDGGIKWEHKSNGLRISQMYRVGVSQTSSKVIAGLQDNGTKLLGTNGKWVDELGGDGMDCAIKSNDANVMYGCIQNGSLQRSTNGGTNWTNIRNNIPGQPSGAWITPYRLMANNPSTIVAGYADIYLSTDQGTVWSTIGTTTQTGTSTKTLLELAPSDPNIIYTGTSSALWKTTDGGTTWATVTTPGNGMVGMVIHPTDPNILWVVRSNYTNGSKVYKSINGGSTWTNVSGNLPNLPANCVVYQNNTQNGLFVGMDIGVYYKDDTMNGWELFMDGLPNVVVSELEIDYTNSYIYAATYGRGLWKSEIPNGIPSCLYPIHISVDDLSTYNAKISWEINNTTNSDFECVFTTSANPPASGQQVSGFNTAFSNLTANTNYYFHIRTLCSQSNSAWITEGPIKTAPQCGQQFYDTGGSSGNYANEEVKIWTICPTDYCNNVRVSFTSFNVEPEWDALYIFNGPNISSPPFLSGNMITLAGFPADGYYGTTPPGTFTSSHSSGCLTFRFLSDESDNRSGWTTNVSCVFKDPMVTNTDDSGPGSLRQGIDCMPASGTVTFSPSLYGQTISLTSGPIHIDRNLSFLQTMSNAINIEGADNFSVFTIAKNVQFYLRHVNIYPGSGTNGRAFYNVGVLTLEDTHIYESISNLGSGSTILNTNIINIIGNSAIHAY